MDDATRIRFGLVLGAVMSVGCSQVPEGIDHAEAALLSRSIDPTALARSASLADVRIRLPPRAVQIPVATLPRVQPHLVTWTRTALWVSQLDRLPLLHFERRDGAILRFQAHFEGDVVMKTAEWDERNGRWVPLEQPVRIETEELDHPLALWSDLAGALELAECRKSAGRFDCEVKPDSLVNAYFPRPLDREEGPMTLGCLQGCPDPRHPEGADFDPIEDSAEASPFESFIEYEYDAAQGMLYQAGREVLPTEPETPHFVSGFMFELTDENLRRMGCEEDDTVRGICAENALDVFYSWSSDGRPPFGRYLPTR